MAKVKEIAQDILTITNDVIINIENDDTGPMVDTMLLRFPHIGQGIFEQLDNKNLTKCRKISKPWSNFIDNQKFYWKRRIQRYRGSMQQYSNQWNKVLKNTRWENVRALCIAVEYFFKYSLGFERQLPSPLHIAAGQGYLQLFKYIVGKTGEQNTANCNGNTPFHLAAANGHLAICSFIIENIEDKNPAANVNGCTPLHYAAEHGNVNGCTPLHYAAEHGHLDVCKLILQNIQEKNPPADNGTPLHLAARRGHLKICRLFIQNGVDKSPIFHGKTPFQMALSHGRFRICLLLINNREDLKSFSKKFLRRPITTFRANRFPRGIHWFPFDHQLQWPL